MNECGIRHAPRALQPYLTRLDSISLERKRASYLSASYTPEDSVFSRHNVFYFSLSLLAMLSDDTSAFVSFTPDEATWVATYIGLALSDYGFVSLIR